MSAQQLLAQDLLNTVGPGRIGLIGASAEFVAELRLSGCAIEPLDIAVLNQSAHEPAENQQKFDTIVLCDDAIGTASRNIELALSAMQRLTRRFVVLLAGAYRNQLSLLGAAGSAHAWGSAAVACGLRRSPVGLRVADYAPSNEAALLEMTVFETIDDTVLADWPLQRLLADRDLHMDMTREVGPRADAHTVRYSLAAQWVRAGDTVLDCACGLGYGSAILAARSRGARFIGVDIDPGSIEHARANFGHYGVEYHAADATRLDFIPDASVDLIVSFETIEHVPDYLSLIDEFARVLKPDGRIIASVPNLWVDETGEDPNPHHFHAFDWDKFAAAFEGRFLIEKRYRQETPSGFKLIHAPRNLQEVPLGMAIDDTEWWVLVASADPRQAKSSAYAHPAFARASATGAHVADFGAWYDNPWIYRSLVQMGERVSDPAQLRALALDTLTNARPESADFGAAATVLVYSVLDHPERFDYANDLLELARAYAAVETDNPHVARWQISLNYALGLLCLSIGERAEAAAWFDRVLNADALRFSPLLATKTVAAGFWRAIMALVDGDTQRAQACLRGALNAARHALTSDDKEAIGDPEAPLSFGFSELAEVADMASQCANALNHLDLFARAPGQFWSLVDVRRFGLSTWAQHLERENRALTQTLNQMHALLLAQHLAQPRRIDTARAA